VGHDPAAGRYARYSLQRCSICERDYETEDMAHCPAYGGPICSLCCTLDVRCHDLCKPDARLQVQWAALLRRLLPRFAWPYLDKGLGHYLLLMLAVLPLLGLLFAVLYHQELRQLTAQDALELFTDGFESEPPVGVLTTLVAPALRLAYLKAFAALAVLAGVVAWWLVLAHKSRQVAQEEANRQTQALNEQTEALKREIELHRQTDLQLQQAKQVADAANQAKSRYITTISHELRTPLNSILGYAQLLEEDEAMPAHRRQAVQVIRRGGDHLLSLIEGTLDIARIESGKLKLDVRPMRLRDSLHELAHLFELQAAAKGIGFRADLDAKLPEGVRADDKRLRQILINVLGNAVKFTQHGEVLLRVRYGGEMARFEISDSGPGMSAEELARIFEPFERGSAAGQTASGGTGLGLTISRMLTDLMGGELTVESRPGVGTTFRIRLFLPSVSAAQAGRALAPAAARTGYLGPRRCVLVVDNEEADRGLLASILAPLGFLLRQAASGEEALALLAELHNGFDPGPAPDAIFMDLAMPGIDGWETLRRLRAQALSAAPAAIVSANAFDKGLDNDVGITPADFLVKPVRVAELLDWLGRRLALQWIEAPRALPAVAVTAGTAEPDTVASPAVGPVAPVWPSGPRLQALQQAADIGHVRGVLRELDALEAEQPACAPLIAQLRTLARQFQLDVMSNLLRKGLHEQRSA
jgi:signal transduction histidine kinase/CheY-like chemotaxis protein